MKLHSTPLKYVRLPGTYKVIIITVFDSISTCLRQNEKKKKKRGLALQSKQNLRIPTDLQKHGKTSK
jgi:hypothetical protein